MHSRPEQRTARSPQPNRLGTPGGNCDGLNIGGPEELFEKAFQLAYFLFPDRSKAFDILIDALKKLAVQGRRERKRLFWRDKHPTHPLRRITRKDADILQWLIMFESEEYEREQERAGNQSLKDMAIRYIKYLVQVTTAKSAFYVNIGLTRLLYNYSTSEAQCAYEMLTHRDVSPDEYRRAKAALMNEMNQRFAKFLRITRVQHGELRFEPCDDQQRWAGLVNACLRAFTPWSTEGLCSQFTTTDSSNTKLVTHALARDDADQNKTEMDYCHILLEPVCYGRLMEELAFDSPEVRLSLPKLFMVEKTGKSDDNGISGRRAPELSQEELGRIRDRLAETDARRQKADPRCVSVLLDRIELAQLDLTHQGQLQIEVEEGASLIEIRGEDDSGALLLATHFISYANNAFGFSEGTAALKNGKLDVAVAPIAGVANDPPRATLTVSYRPKLLVIRPWTAWRVLWGRRPILSYALTGLAMAVIGWGLASAFYARKIALIEQTHERAANNRSVQLQTEAQVAVSYVLVPDDERVRGQEEADIPKVSLRSNPQVVSLELRLSGIAESGAYSADLETFSGDRALMTQNFLRAKRTAGGTTVAILAPADLLEAGKYYTVQLHSISTNGRSGQINRFTFKVVADE